MKGLPSSRCREGVGMELDGKGRRNGATASGPLGTVMDFVRPFMAVMTWIRLYYDLITVIALHDFTMFTTKCRGGS
jgi:hypothetical protein